MVKLGSKWRQEENPFRVHENYVEFFFFRRDRSLHDKPFIVDVSDFEIVRSYRWCLQCKRYVYNTEVGLLHRFLLNASKSLLVDHKDGNGLNNRRENIRVCNQTQNLGNSKVPISNKTGFKGVYTTENSQKPRTFPFMSKIHLIFGHNNFILLFCVLFQSKSACFTAIFPSFWT